MTEDDVRKITSNPMVPKDARNLIDWLFREAVELRRRVDALEAAANG